MKWHKFKDIEPETNTYVLYYLPKKPLIEVYINEDGMILEEPNDSRIKPSVNAYWAELPELPE